MNWICVILQNGTQMICWIIIQKTSIENDEPVQSTHILIIYYLLFLIQLTYVTVS